MHQVAHPSGVIWRADVGFRAENLGTGQENQVSGSDRSPVATIITATYNRAELLGGAIRSVLNQDLPAFEYLIVDDGSTDQTPEVVHPYLVDPRVRYLRASNQGQPRALNLGLRHASAELVGFLDSDDELKSDHLSRLRRELKAGGYDFLLGRFELIVPAGGPEPRVTDFYNRERTIPVRDIECITGALFGRREVFQAVGGFRDVPFSDTDLFQRLREAGYRWTRVDSPTYRYYFGRSRDSLAIRQSEEA